MRRARRELAASRRLCCAQAVLSRPNRAAQGMHFAYLLADARAVIFERAVARALTSSDGEGEGRGLHEAQAGQGAPRPTAAAEAQHVLGSGVEVGGGYADCKHPPLVCVLRFPRVLLHPAHSRTLALGRGELMAIIGACCCRILQPPVRRHGGISRAQHKTTCARARAHRPTCIPPVTTNRMRARTGAPQARVQTHAHLRCWHEAVRQDAPRDWSGASGSDKSSRSESSGMLVGTPCSPCTMLLVRCSQIRYATILRKGMRPHATTSPCKSRCKRKTRKDLRLHRAGPPSSHPHPPK